MSVSMNVVFESFERISGNGFHCTYLRGYTGIYLITSLGTDKCSTWRRCDDVTPIR